MFEDSSVLVIFECSMYLLINYVCYFFQIFLDLQLNGLELPAWVALEALLLELLLQTIIIVWKSNSVA